MKTIQILSIITRAAMMVTLLLGLTFWVTGWDIIGFHMAFGLTGAVGLLSLSVGALLTRGVRPLGAITLAYSVLFPLFGRYQATILIGNMHWLIQVAHLAVGIGAMVLAMAITRRLRLPQSQPDLSAPAGSGQALIPGVSDLTPSAPSPRKWRGGTMGQQ